MRLAETALCSRGSSITMLRMPGLATSGADAEQLGLATPQFQDEPIGPTVWRKAGVDTTLLVAAGAIARLVGSTGFVSAEALFEAAAGVVVDGIFYTILNSEPIVSGDVPCGYRLSVAGPIRS